MAEFILDGLNGESSPISLEAHAPSVGGAWVKHTPGYSDILVANAYATQGASSTLETIYYNDEEPPSADYTTICQMASNQAGNVIALMARFDPVSGNRYQVTTRTTGSTGAILEKIVGGVRTTLATFQGRTANVIGTFDTWALACTGDAIVVLRNESSVAAVTDSDITDAGYAGIVGGNPTNTNGTHRWRAFSATTSGAVVEADGTSLGVGTASGQGQRLVLAESLAGASGSADASAQAMWFATGYGNVEGTGAALGVGVTFLYQSGDGTASGGTTTNWRGRSTAQADGIVSCSAVTDVISNSLGAGETIAYGHGFSNVSGAASSVRSGVGGATGLSAVNGSGVRLEYSVTVGDAAGSATVTGVRWGIDYLTAALASGTAKARGSYYEASQTVARSQGRVTIKGIGGRLVTTAGTSAGYVTSSMVAVFLTESIASTAGVSTGLFHPAFSGPASQWRVVVRRARSRITQW